MMSPASLVRGCRSLICRWGAGLALLVIAAATPPAAARTVPDETTMARLVWATMIAVDHANRTGNYDVLHALGTPQFQARNSAEALGDVFSGLRDRRVDVGRAVLLTPTYYMEPEILESGALRLRGGFEFRPRSLRFDIVFLPVDGGWRVHGLSVAEMSSDAPR